MWIFVFDATSYAIKTIPGSEMINASGFPLNFFRNCSILSISWFLGYELTVTKIFFFFYVQNLWLLIVVHHQSFY